MGIEEVTRYTVRCDGCGRRLIDNFGRFAESHTSDDAEEVARYQGWFVGPTRILCEDCATEKTEGNNA